MRSRRHKGRREPLYWSRSCATTFTSHTATGSILDCESTEVEMGVVLFDASAAQLNQAESDITLRKLKYPMDFTCFEGNQVSGMLPMSMWEVVLVTDRPENDFLNVTLESLLSAEDIVSVRMFGLRLRGALTEHNNDTQLAGQAPGGASELNVMRKMTVTHKIIALYGFMTHFGGTDTVNSIWSINMVISALWQRTLR